MHLKIGIMGRQEGWKLLFQQIGIPAASVSNTLLPEEFSVVAASDDINDRESEMLRQYLALGGALLCSTRFGSAAGPVGECTVRPVGDLQTDAGLRCPGGQLPCDTAPGRP